MLSYGDRWAAIRGLKRGLVSAAVSMVLLLGLAFVLVRQRFTDSELYPERDSFGELLSGNSQSILRSFDSSWALLAADAWWRTLLTALLAVALAAGLTMLLARLRSRSHSLGQLVTYAVAYVFGAVSVVLLVRTLSRTWFRLGFEHGPLPPTSYGVLVPGLVVGIVLAGFGARVLLQYASLPDLRADPSAALIDGWLAVLWLGCALIAFEVILSFQGVGYFLYEGIKRDPSILLASTVVLVVPAILLAILLEVAWSIGRARRTAGAASDIARGDGGTAEADPLGGSATTDSEWQLWPAVSARRRVSIGFTVTALLALFCSAVVVLEWTGYQPFQSQQLQTSPRVSLFTPPVFAGALVATVVATGAGLLFARALDAFHQQRWIQAVTVDPIATVLQFPVVYVVVLIAPVRIESVPDSEFLPVALVLGILGGFALAPLVARVALDDRNRGRSSDRVAVRSLGIALCGAAVVSIWTGWLLSVRGTFWKPPFGVWWEEFLRFSAFALVHTGGLFLLGDGLRDAASPSQD